MGELGGLEGFVAGWPGGSASHLSSSESRSSGLGLVVYEPTVFFGHNSVSKYRVGFI